MIVVTGAAGFIGSALLSRLIEDGYGELIAVDNFEDLRKSANFSNKKVKAHIGIEAFPDWLRSNGNQVQFVHHIGARTDTAEFDKAVLNKLNTEYTKTLFQICSENQISFIYASSAATYGDGSKGFDDDENRLLELEPLNEYGQSKHEFDKWVVTQTDKPYFWAGFKFFNVFGPNEYHKGRMASVVFHAYHQIIETNNVKLFKSHVKDYEDGKQLRDFIYVKDVVDVLMHFMVTRKNSGIYNLGTGIPRSFYDLADATFKALKRETQIEYIDIPLDIREKYQYYTAANMSKLRAAGYNAPFTTLESAIEDYVQHYLPDKIL